MNPCDIQTIKDCYINCKNYIIQRKSLNTNCVVIYFSSNGIYYPNEEAVFTKEIVNKNKFDWYTTRVKRSDKDIFVRDVYKQWYIKGINSKISSHSDLFTFLKKRN